jgi:hypothetical protein
MVNFSHSLGSFLIIVGFLVLTALATILYGGSTDQQEKMKQNFFWQGSRYAVDTLWTAATGIGGAGPDKNKEISDNPADDSVAGTNFWLNFKTRLAREWSDSETSFTAEEDPGFLRWQKTERGAEIIFRAKSGEEHKLLLPFKFLGH